MRKKIHATSHRRDLCIYGGSRGQKETFVLGTGFLAISGILFLALDLSFGAAIVISSTIAIVVCGSQWDVFAHGGGFPLSYHL